MNIDQMISAYEAMIEPTNFVELFNTMSDFRDWCELGTIEDLEYTLDIFKNYEEVYEYCTVITEVINQKQKELR